MYKLGSVLWVTATGTEANVLGGQHAPDPGYYPDYQVENHNLLVTGPGILSSAVALTTVLAKENFGLVIHFGIAGSFRPDLVPGAVVQVVSEELGDFGADNRGNFLSAFDLQFADPNGFPFQNGLLVPDIPPGFNLNLPKVHGVTVNTVHGSADKIAAFRLRSKAEVESMEGAAVFYAALLFNTPCVQIRAVSNFVEPRNRESWEIGKALTALGIVLADIRSQITAGSL